MIRRILLCVPLLVLTGGNSLSSAESANGTTDGGLMSGRDLVIGAGDDAVRIRVRLLVDGKPLPSVRQGLINRIITQENQDGDETLSGEEWRQVLELLGRSRVPAGSGVLTLNVARSSQDPEGHPEKQSGPSLSMTAATMRISQFLGPPIEFVEQPRPLVDRLDLFHALDKDGDKHIARAEFAQAPELMGWYDADGDGTLDMPELAPTEPLRPVAVPTEAGLPVGRYPFSWEPAKGTPDLLVDLMLIGRAFGRPKIVVQDLNPNGANNKRIEVVEENRSVTLKIGALSLVLEAKLSLISPLDVKRFYMISAMRRDANKNGYLDKGEFFGMALPGMSFDEADQNGDGMLYTEELVDELEGLIVRETNGVRIEISFEREALFTRLDVDQDNRLSRGELLAAGEHALPAKVEQLSWAALGGQYRMKFGVPGLLDMGDPQMRVQVADMARARMPRTGEGPDWFQAMDRNNDGDLARREFLGTGERFRRMDMDGNGLLSLGELDVSQKVTEQNVDAASPN